MIKFLVQLLFLLPSSTLSGQSSEGTAVRKLLRDSVEASFAPSGSRSFHLQNAFNNNVEGINVLISRQDHTQLLAEAGIDRYGVVRPEHLGFTELVSQLISRFEIGKKNNKPLSPNEVRALSQAIIKEPIADQFVRVLQSKINSIKFSEQKVMAELFDADSGFQMRDPNLEHLIRNELPKYYDNMSVQEKSRIVHSILSLPANADHFDHLEVMLQETGPFVQKLFQLLKDNVSSPRLAEIFGKIQSQVKPFPFDRIKPIVERNYGPINKAFKSFNPEPLASGTIGQVHIAVLHSGEEVIVKVRRPEVMQRLRSDIANLQTIVKEPGLRELVGKMQGTIFTETDFRREAEFLRQGEVYIDQQKGITIAKLHRDFEPKEEILVI